MVPSISDYNIQLLPFDINNSLASNINNSYINETSNNTSNFTNVDLTNIYSNFSFPHGMLAYTLLFSLLQIETLGLELYTFGAILLIVIGVILLLAMLSPIVLTFKSQEEDQEN